jgi:hypothetical protein
MISSISAEDRSFLAAFNDLRTRFDDLAGNCRFRLGAISLEAGLQVYPCRHHHLTLRSSENVILHLNPTEEPNSRLSLPVMQQKGISSHVLAE